MNTMTTSSIYAGAWARAIRLASLPSADRAREHLGRTRRISNGADFFRITNATGGTATLDLYDEIGFHGVTSAEFSQQLRAVTASTLNVRVNSPGGDPFDAAAIYNMLRSHAAKVHVTVDGLAASTAALVCMAGDTVTVMPNSMLMIDDAAAVCLGTEADMRDTADLLDKVSASFAGIYAAKAGKGTAADWRTVMRAEQWYTADEAVTAGLADRVGDTDSPSSAPDVSKHWNLSAYAYSGRRGAPAPKPMTATPAWDPAAFTQAIGQMRARR